MEDQKPPAAKYANLIYSDFCASSAELLGLEPIDMGYGDPASEKHIPQGFLSLLVEELHQKNAGAYPGVAGDKELIEAFRGYIRENEKLKREYHLAIVSGGGRSALTNILRVFSKPRDIILIPYPAWSGYKAVAAYVDAIIFPIKTTMENRFVPSGEDVQNAIDDAKRKHPDSDVKLAILNTPHNPTGTVYSEGSAREVLKVLRENEVACIADYTYRAIRSEQTEAVSLHHVAEKLEEEEGCETGSYTDNVIAMQTLGKVSLTPGLRIGYVATTDERLIESFCARKQATDFSGGMFIQKALARYLGTEAQKAEFQETVSLFDERREALLGHMKGYGYSPEKGNIIINASGFYVSFEVPREFQKTYALSEFDRLMRRPFTEENIDMEEYRGFFEPKGRIPPSEVFVLKLLERTGVNMLPGRLFCPAGTADVDEYESWVRLALIHDVDVIDEAFSRIEKCRSILTY